MDLRTTIRETSKKHLVENNGVLMSQCVTAVGYIANTVPSDIPGNHGIIELPTSDCSNSAIACGFALAGRRPIYVIRYQGFMSYNSASLLNYAAISKEMWDQPCPVFVRSISMNGNIGPVASSSRHSNVCHHPGIKVFAPCTPREWLHCWNEYILGDDPVYCSENRKFYDVEDSVLDFPHLTDWNHGSPTTIIGIGEGRLQFKELFINTNYNLVNLYQLKPLVFSLEAEKIISNSKLCIVVDSDYKTCGMSESVAYNIMRKYKVESIALGVSDKIYGFGAFDNQIERI